LRLRLSRLMNTGRPGLAPAALGGAGCHSCLRILERRVLDLNIEVTATIVADQVRADILVAGSLRCVGLVRKAAEKGLGYTLLEVRAGIRGDYLLAQGGRKIIVADAEHIQTDAVVEQLDFQRFIGRDAGRGVQRDCVPRRLDPRIRHALMLKELAHGVGAINFEAVIGTAEFLEKPKVVERGAKRTAAPHRTSGPSGVQVRSPRRTHDEND